ncbi:hypothetical protein MACH16_04470 [Marinomonas pontica]|uniref:Uncharacterized protein n=1 Tax=Marinomonas pontica TaxID=264739 RepID=A0ABM8F9M9_9GAMM|nr:hypothetical protein MACH16_04470 [Marinomonas pontica]
MRVGRRQALNKEKPHPAMQGGVFSLWANIYFSFVLLTPTLFCFYWNILRITPNFIHKKSPANAELMFKSNYLSCVVC